MKTLLAACITVALGAGLQACNTKNVRTSDTAACGALEAKRDAVSKDLAEMDADASSIEGMPAGSDDTEARRFGEEALERCDDIRITLAHARGIAWAINDDLKACKQPVFPDDAFQKLEDIAKTCRGDASQHGLPLSPAQLRSGLVAKVHALKSQVSGG